MSNGLHTTSTASLADHGATNVFGARLWSTPDGAIHTRTTSPLPGLAPPAPNTHLYHFLDASHYPRDVTTAVLPLLKRIEADVLLAHTANHSRAFEVDLLLASPLPPRALERAWDEARQPQSRYIGAPSPVRVELPDLSDRLAHIATDDLVSAHRQIHDLIIDINDIYFPHLWMCPYVGFERLWDQLTDEFAEDMSTYAYLFDRAPLAGFDPAAAALRLRLLGAVRHPEEARKATALALELASD